MTQQNFFWDTLCEGGNDDDGSYEFWNTYYIPGTQYVLHIHYFIEC